MPTWNSAAHKWEGAGSLWVPLNAPLPPRPEATADEEEEKRRLDRQAAPRRILLLAADGTIERVLAEPKASEALAEFRRLCEANPGRRIAAEWLAADGWRRWLEGCTALSRVEDSSTPKTEYSAL